MRYGSVELPHPAHTHYHALPRTTTHYHTLPPSLPSPPSPPRHHARCGTAHYCLRSSVSWVYQHPHPWFGPGTFLTTTTTPPPMPLLPCCLVGRLGDQSQDQRHCRIRPADGPGRVHHVLQLGVTSIICDPAPPLSRPFFSVHTHRPHAQIPKNGIL